MEKKEMLARLRSGTMSRRDFGRMAAAFGVTMTMLPLAARQAAAASKLTVFEWAGYEVPELHPGYADKHGGEPEFAFFSSEEEALQKLLGGYAVDVCHPCSYNVKRWKDADIIKPIDVTRLSNYPDLWEKFKTIPNTVFGSDVYFVPFDCGNSSILYRTDLVDPADATSWDLLFNEKYAGKLSMYNTDTTIIEISARILGYPNLTSLSDEQLETIKPMIAKQRDILRFYWDDVTQIEQALASGELVAAYAWNGSVKNLRDQGVDVTYMVPKEGILAWVCGLTLDARAPGDEQAAYDFVDAMLSPEAGRFLLAEQGYGHSNRKAYELVDQKVLDDLGWTNPEESFARADISDEAEEPFRSKYIELVNNVKAGLN